MRRKIGDYSLWSPDGQVPAEAGQLVLPLGDSGESWGKAQPVTVSLDSSRWLVTNVYAFPWNRITVDGNPVAYRVSEGALAIQVPAGRHRIATRFDPPLLWRWLWRGAWAALAVLGGLLLGKSSGFGLGGDHFRRRRTRQCTAPF
jgi:hypothetical protein